MVRGRSRAGCALAAVVVGVAVVSGAAGSARAKLPAGVFRTTITDADIRPATTDVPENHGTYTMTIRPNGRWTLRQKAPNPLEVSYETGIYTISAGRVDFKAKTPAQFDGADVIATWRYDGKSLTFKVIRADYPEDYVVYGKHPWRKVG